MESIAVGDSLAFGALVILLGILMVALILVARRERRLSGWRGDATARIRSAMQDLAEAEIRAIEGNYEETLRLIQSAEQSLEEVRGYPERYPDDILTEEGDGTRPN